MLLSYLQTLYSGKLSQFLKTHFHLGKIVSSARRRKISFITSSGMLCKFLSWGITIEEYSLDNRVFVSLIFLFLQLFNVSWNYLIIIQFSHPHICLYFGVNFFNWGGNKNLNAVSLTNSLLSFQTLSKSPSFTSFIKSLCSSLIEHLSNNLPIIFSSYLWFHQLLRLSHHLSEN